MKEREAKVEPVAYEMGISNSYHESILKWIIHVGIIENINVYNDFYRRLGILRYIKPRTFNMTAKDETRL